MVASYLKTFLQNYLYRTENRQSTERFLRLDRQRAEH